MTRARAFTVGLTLGACVGLVACEQEGAAPSSAELPAIGEDLAVPDRLPSTRDALADLLAACDGGDGEACNMVGRHYLARPGAAETARERFRAACKAGVQVGCNNQAVMELRRAPKDKKALQLAGDLLVAACDEGLAAACGNLALMLQELTQGAGDRANVAARKGCVAGDGRSCVLVARGLTAAGKPDPAEADKVLRAACTSGRPEACGLLGEAPPTGVELLDELDPIEDPFACSDEGWLARMAATMKLETAARVAPAPAEDPPDCDLWAIR